MLGVGQGGPDAEGGDYAVTGLIDPVVALDATGVARTGVAGAVGEAVGGMEGGMRNVSQPLVGQHA